jgi:ABC-type bacteriocin/lantibiotic exporter with double-glycine peptidase domain
MIWPWIKKTALRRQIEPIECGAATLGMILEYFGCYIGNPELRKAAQVSRNGADAKSIIKAAKFFGLTAVAKHAILSDLHHQKPSILFFDNCHFIVFEGEFLGHYFINDPARGRYFLPKEEFRKRFSKIVITFSKNKNFIKRKKITPIATVWHNNFFLITLGLLFGIIVTILTAALGLVLRGFNWQVILVLLTLVGLEIFCLTILRRAILSMSFSRCKTELDILQNGLMSVPYSFFDDVPFSRFATAFLSAFDRSFKYCENQAKKFFFVPFIGVLLAFVAISYWPLVILFVLFGVLYLCQFWLRHLLVGKSKLIFKDFTLNKMLERVLDMRAMGQEDFLVESLLKTTLNDVADATPNLFLLLLSPIILLPFFSLSFFLMIKNAWQFNQLHYYEIFSLLFLSFAYFFALKNLSSSLMFESDQEMESLLDEFIYAAKIIKQIKQVKTNELIKIEKVTFRYRGTSNAIFENIDLSINQGEIYGLVSQPDLGASTLLRLVAGKILPSTGHIIHYSEKKRPLRIALIDIDTDLFGGSLKNNLILFEQQIAESSLIDALEKAQATNLFYNRPMGLLSHISPHGKNLSIGEKKQLLLAQALLKTPDLILLDDFFATLDDTKSIKILENLQSLGITVIFNSYQSGILRRCDRVILIQNKKTLRIDKHEHLMLTDQTYQQLITVSREDRWI